MSRNVRSFLVAAFLIVLGQIAGLAVSGPAIAPSDTPIIVPEKKGTPISIDGILAPGEWDGAVHFPISESWEVYLCADAESLYVGFKLVKEFTGVALGEVYIASNGEEFYNLHASGSLAEGLNLFSAGLETAKYQVGYYKDWESDVGKSEARLFGKEYRIGLKKFTGRPLKFAAAILAVNRSGRESSRFPAKFDFGSSAGWAELVLPGGGTRSTG
ncbi:MAG TPA: hypothetical protein PKI53_12535 [Candidatus Aminicenantes bacterium]|nr:hypothetical protein [Candidatus Aminicenantes bacterium]HOF83798.1 hypothetical protein [Candidatus Aminicenantes bacterium]HOS11882.1 hypothetical protein [Candidatus Aminicenantes bacterium]HQH46562.1 hypothetical protein [Candidatus Aminicenantes bacterium]